MVEEVIYNIKNLKELRFYEVLEDYMPVTKVEGFDYTITRLRKEPSKYMYKGIKDSTEYTKDGVVHVCKHFLYIDEVDEDNPETGVWITIDWLKHDGSVGVEKTFFKPIDKIELAKIHKANRDRSIVYLQASAEGTPIETHVNTLLRHYKSEIELFIQNNTDDFLIAMDNEEDPIISAYLQITIEPPTESFPLGKKVIESIKLQIHPDW